MKESTAVLLRPQRFNDLHVCSKDRGQDAATKPMISEKTRTFHEMSKVRANRKASSEKVLYAIFSFCYQL